MSHNTIQLVIFDLDDTLYSSKNNALFHRVPSLLNTIKDCGCKIALASYNAYADDVLNKCGIIKSFDYIEFEDLVHSAQILKTMQKLCNKGVENDWKWSTCVVNDKTSMLSNIIARSGVHPENTLFVDDQDRYIQAARKLGMRTCLVDQDGVSRDRIMACFVPEE